MADELPLLNIRVLVTRPENQAAGLSAAISKAGGDVILFPLIVIKPVAREYWQPLELDQADWIVFVSSNAVRCFVAGLTAPLKKAIRLAAVGAGTAAAMQQAGLKVDLQPVVVTGSEGLLVLPEWQTMQDQRVIIVRGIGGRELLADTLTQRGARIGYAEVYERCLPAPTVAQCIEALATDRIICTSGAGISNLCQLLYSQPALLLNKPLLVISERLRKQALLGGFQHVWVSKDASDEAILQRLTEMER